MRTLALADSGGMESDTADEVMDEKSSKPQETQPYVHRDADTTESASATEVGFNGVGLAKPEEQTIEDKNPIFTPGEGEQSPPRPVDGTPEIRTQRVRPPRWSPRSRSPIWTYALAAALIGIPGGLWLAAVLTSPHSSVENYSWLGSRPSDKPGVVYLQPASGGDDLRIALWRDGNRIRASTPPGTSPAVEWSYPTETDAKLLKTSLEETALMIPPRGPFSVGGDAAKAALLVYWKKAGDGEEITRISMLDRRGRVLWERSVDTTAAAAQGYWVSHDGVGCLALAAAGGETLLIDPITGRVVR